MNGDMELTEQEKLDRVAERIFCTQKLGEAPPNAHQRRPGAAIQDFVQEWPAGFRGSKRRLV